jgi:peptidoglycan hydrolase CwlO-like protein
MTKTNTVVVVAVCGVIVGSALSAVAVGQDSTPSQPQAAERTLPACETELLDARSALVDAQEQLALWQARAIQAEAKLARQEIERRRQALAPKPQ